MLIKVIIRKLLKIAGAVFILTGGVSIVSTLIDVLLENFVQEFRRNGIRHYQIRVGSPIVVGLMVTNFISAILLHQFIKYINVSINFIIHGILASLFFLGVNLLLFSFLSANINFKDIFILRTFAPVFVLGFFYPKIYFFLFKKRN